MHIDHDSTACYWLSKLFHMLAPSHLLEIVLISFFLPLSYRLLPNVQVELRLPQKQDYLRDAAVNDVYLQTL